MNTKSILVIIVLVALLCGAWYYLCGTTGPASEPSAKEFTLKVANKKLVSGPDILTAKVGDTVTIKITSDIEEELHLHGYDKSVDLSPNQEATLSFVADASGRFPYELEKSKTEIGALEVQP